MFMDLYKEALAQTVLSYCSSNLVTLLDKSCHIAMHCLTNLVTLLVFIVKPQVEHYKAVLAQTESMLTSLQVRNLSPLKMNI